LCAANRLRRPHVVVAGHDRRHFEVDPRTPSTVVESTMTMPSMLWRRIDSPGHDACRLARHDAGWTLEGTAVFGLGGVPARLTYTATCDASWRAQRGHVSGWIGERSVESVLERAATGTWTLDGADLPGSGHCLDLDFGFTPSTNLLQLRRLALAEGQGADAPAAWLDVSTGVLAILVQRYERRSDTTYWYEAPRFGYAELLEVDSVGFVRRYPGLWQAETLSV
jgi:hypothetical protein